MPLISHGSWHQGTLKAFPVQSLHQTQLGSAAVPTRIRSAGLERAVLVIVAAALADQSRGEAQAPSADSLVAYWVERGPSGSWSPGQLYVGCPALKPWQQRGTELLMTTTLSRERRKDLALAWSGALQTCRDSRLERWYVEQVTAEIRQGESVDGMLAWWTALNRADSPGLRTFLRNLMVDLTLSEPYRNAAASALFAKLDLAESLREYLAGFEATQLPFEAAVGTTWRILKLDAETLLSEVGARVRDRPELADQLAFTAIVESAERFATATARDRLARALEEGLAKPGLSENLRTRLLQAIRRLRVSP